MAINSSIVIPGNRKFGPKQGRLRVQEKVDPLIPARQRRHWDIVATPKECEIRKTR